ncbi:MAG: hypothetical protein NVSMB44_17770 [Ktedonobacteraceae bacterium]
MLTTCKGCGQPIRGNYFQALGAVWHPEHFVCAACTQPIGDTSFNIHEGAPYHIECYNRQIAPRCVYCSQPLAGTYRIDYWGQKFCQEHEGQYPSCTHCGRLIPPAQIEQRGSGAQMMRCRVCRSTAVETAAEAKPLFSQAIRWVSSQGLVYNNLHLGLELCEREKLGQILQGRNQGHALGATTSVSHTYNGYDVHKEHTEVSGVAVLRGLPVTLFQGVTIHELGHVWLIVHGIRNLPDWAEEGFCELLSYRYYNDQHTAESLFHSMSIEQNRDHVYGDGFRRIRVCADATGFPRFVELLRTTKRLPAGW